MLIRSNMNSEGQSVSERNVLWMQSVKKKKWYMTTMFKRSPVFYSYKNKLKATYLVRVG